MRKKLAVVAVIGLALILLTEPALAAGSAARTVLAAPKSAWTKYHIISFTGTITSISGGGKFYVRVQMTNNPYIAKRGTLELVTTTSSTIFYFWTGSTGTTRTGYSGYSTLAVGQLVSINAIATTSTTTAKRVEVSKPRY